MNYEHFEHQADIGIRGFGKTPEEAFANGAKAMFDIMCNLSKVKKIRKVDVECNSHELDELFVEFLNELISLSEIEEVMFCEFQLKITKGDRYYLKGTAFGDTTDVENHQLKTQAKAATFSNLKVFNDGKKWTAQCIIDV